jgi:hypothetical protein
MAWLASEPTFAKLLVVELWCSLLFGVNNGTMIPTLVEMTVKVRTAAFFARIQPCHRDLRRVNAGHRHRSD